MAHLPVDTSGVVIMAYLAQRPRVDKPIRLCLADDLGHRIDGAWWPYTAVLADELAGLVAALDSQLGKIVGVGLNWSSRHSPPNLNWQDWRTRPQHIITADGLNGRAKVLVVPSTTNSALAAMVLRRAAGLPVIPRRGEDGMLTTANEILSAARLQHGSRKPLG